MSFAACSKIKVGERRVTKAKHRVMIAQEIISPDGARGGEVRFVFDDDPPNINHERRMAVRNWKRYELETS